MTINISQRFDTIHLLALSKKRPHLKISLQFTEKAEAILQMTSSLGPKKRGCNMKSPLYDSRDERMVQMFHIPATPERQELTTY